MSICVTKTVKLSEDYAGGVLPDTDYAWLPNGPSLEVINTKTGNTIGAWTFGWVLKDTNTEVVCVDVIQRHNRRLPLLAVGIDCKINGGMICIFDFVTSRILRAINLQEKITSLHVIDSGLDVFTLPGPLRNFDGIIGVGTAGGGVFLIDICRQICDEVLTTGLTDIRDELNPCQLNTITLRDIPNLERHKQLSMSNSHHLAIHLNFVFDKSTSHFILKGPNGDDRIHVNKEEVTVSALYYCSPLGSLLVGYNFGALQMYNLMNLQLVYTSPVCDEHLPITHFTIQEPADDPRPVCYIWAVYSSREESLPCLPLAVMYSFSYQTKEYHDGYGFLYQEFNSAAVQYQMELNIPDGVKYVGKIRGGSCVKLNAISKGLLNREGPHHDSNEDGLTLCVFLWNVWFTNNNRDTFLAVFDLNQWYKEQMPNLPNPKYSSTYMIQIHLNDLINTASNKSAPIFDVFIDKNSIRQFKGPQRLEEHFYPNSLTFGLTCLRQSDVVTLRNYGVQKALLVQIESAGPLCLIEPAEISQEIVSLGLAPLFIDLPVNSPITTSQQREIILSTALENHLVAWLCKCAREWANGSFLSAGCSLDLLISWAFQRAITLKTNCDKFCVPLFDYSQIRIDNNTNILFNCCTRQLKALCSLFDLIIKELSRYLSNLELVREQLKSLETVFVYFEVLQWFLNVGLLPECPLTAYPRSDDLERINAPYPAGMLIEFYNHRRGLLKIANEKRFHCSESALFIDSLIERECGGETLQKQWRNDGGNGLYPPPSLQALLRTYLVDNVKLFYKHSVVMYLFLDLAMSLDQERYKPVITHLIKFPAVFKVTPSVIKITQALWQLDHGDFNTAMGLLTDPLVSPDDLHDWHHKIVLRSLMLQEQHNWALLYLQIRRPPMKDDEDIMTAISLYVANNMLDEAFYFEKHCTNRLQHDKYMTHLLNECQKNDKLRGLIYRTFTPTDENLFLKYLSNSEQPEAQDLHVYYHILRSHFIEAFESHERTAPNQIENRGLVGKQNAVPRDKLVYALKKILPDINRNLISHCHKENSSVWNQVSRPTPMSVFVHKLGESVNYKSTLIGVALAKAKQTFSEAVSNKVETEETPFLRTPTASKSFTRSPKVIVNPKIIEYEDDDAPPSTKRLKLSPRPNASLTVSIPSKFDTPLVKRKTPKVRDSGETNVVTPHSILKVKSTANHESQFEDDFKEFKKLEYTPVKTPLKKSGLGLSPRKSITKSTVRFEGLLSSSSSGLLETPEVVKKLSLSPANTSLDSVNCSKSTSSENVFHSAETSLEKEKTPEKQEQEVEVSQVSAVEKEVVVQSPADEEREKQEISAYSPRGRRSYKRELTPVRSSMRLSKGTPKEASDGALSSLAETPKSPLPKLRPRKSLCRQVLETNAVHRAINTPTSRKVAKVDESTETIVIESTEKYEDGEEKRTSSVKKYSVVDSFTETDCNSSSSFTFGCDQNFSLSFSMDLDNSSKAEEKKEQKEEIVQNENLKSHKGRQSSYISVNRTSCYSDIKTDDDFTFDYIPDLNITTSTNEEKDDSEVMEVDEVSQPSEEPVYCGLEPQTKEIECYVDEVPQPSEESVYCELKPQTEETKCDGNDGENKEAAIQDVEIEKVSLQTTEISVLEISDDMSLNDGFIIEKEVTLEETQFGHEEEDNEDAAEQNIFNTSLTSEENSHSQDENHKEDEVIEIGSSSEDEKSKQDSRSSSRSSDYNESSEEKLQVSYERNIYDSFSEHSSDSYERHHSEISENSDDNGRYEKRNATVGLFKSCILLNEDEDEEEPEAASRLGEKGEHQRQELVEENASQMDEDLPEQNVDETQREGMAKGIEESSILHKEVVDSDHSKRENLLEQKEQEKVDETQREDMATGIEESSILHEEVEDSDHNKRENLLEQEEQEKVDETQMEAMAKGREETNISHEEVKNSDHNKQENLLEQEEQQEVDETQKEDMAKGIEEANILHEEVKSSDQNKQENLLKQGEQEKIDETQKEDMTKGIEETNISHEEVQNSDHNKHENLLHQNEQEENIQGDAEEDKTKGVEVIKDGNCQKQNLPEPINDVLEKNESTQSQAVEQEEQQYYDPLDMTKSEFSKFVGDKNTKVQEVKCEERLRYDPLDMTESELSKFVCVLDQVSQDQKDATSCSDKSIEMDELKCSEDESVEEPCGNLDPLDMVPSKSVPACIFDQKPEESIAVNKRSSKRATDTTEGKLLQGLEVALPKRSSKTDDAMSETTNLQPVRILRSRRVSSDQPAISAKPRKKRSASLDEAKPKETDQSEKGAVPRQRKGGRAASVVNLPKIEEENGIKKKSASMLEGYSMNRRMTRRQMAMLKETTSVYSLKTMDPIVLLDKIDFKGKPDPEEKKVYETSPSTSNCSSSQVKPSKRLRSASQTSNDSRRSRSRTPVRTREQRRKSTDERSDLSSASREKPQGGRITRSRSRSVLSDDSVASGPVQQSKHKQRVVTLPEIEEEPEISVKRRRRKAD